MDSEKKDMLKVLKSLSSPQLPKKRPVKESNLDKNWKKNPLYKSVGLNSESYVAIDCEMVSTENDKNTLARVSIVNMEGDVLLDLYVKPEEKVLNYRTFVTGIKARHLNTGKPFKEVRKMVKGIIRNQIVVGHAIHNDLSALKIDLPKDKIRDTQSLYSEASGVSSISLQKLCQQTLSRIIQTGQHSSVEDAWATMEIFKTLFLANKTKKPKNIHKKPKIDKYKTFNDKEY